MLRPTTHWVPIYGSGPYRYLRPTHRAPSSWRTRPIGRVPRNQGPDPPGPFAAYTGYTYSHRWLDGQLHNITEWASREIRTIVITQEYSNDPGLSFRIRKFVPVE